MSLNIKFIGKIPPPIGGVTIHTYRLFQWLKKYKKISINLTALNDTENDDRDVKYIGNIYLWLVKKVLFSFQEDIIHYHGSDYRGLLLLVLVKKLHNDFKLVWSIQGEHIVPMIQSKNKFMQSIIYDLDTIIVANKYIQEGLYSLGVDKKNVVVISPFLMPLDNNPKQLLAKYKKKERKILIFNAYRLEFNKKGEDIYGFATLIKSFKYINVNTTLVLLIPQMNQLEKKYYHDCINELNEDYKQRIILIQDEKNQGWEYINEADIFIRPTITDGDSISVKEALCCEVPTIVSDCTYRPEETIKFKTGDYHSLAHAVNDLINNYIVEKHKLLNLDLCNKSNGNDFLNLYLKIGKN